MSELRISQVDPAVPAWAYLDSAAYRYDPTTKRGDWADVVPLAMALIAAGPDRMLWGTNWPHPGRERNDITKVTPYQVVDNPKLLTHFAEQCRDAAVRKMILVDTPQRLYGFA